MTRWNLKTYTYNGETHTVKEWAELKGIKYSTLSARMRLNLSPEEIFLPKIPKKPPQKTARIGNRNIMPYTWTDIAQECYFRGCRCKGCLLMPDELKEKCRMKKTVRELVRLYGAPDNNMRELIND